MKTDEIIRPKGRTQWAQPVPASAYLGEEGNVINFFSPDVEYIGTVTDWYAPNYLGGKRHLTPIEINALLEPDESKVVWDRKVRGPMIASMMLGYIHEVRESARLNDRHFFLPLLLDCAVRIIVSNKKEKIIEVFHGIDGKIRNVSHTVGGGMEFTITDGFEPIEGVQLPSQTFNIARMFEKDRGFNLKELNKASPDLIEYLFEGEFESLCPLFQNAEFVVPQVSDKMMFPLGIDFRISPIKATKIYKDRDDGISLTSVKINKATIVPFSYQGIIGQCNFMI